MEQELVWEMVQGQIGYRFKNIDLLKQAFTRRSYTEENGGENNEVLEFIGDKALDFAVVKLLSQKHGHVEPYGFRCEHDENELTKIRSRMVSKKSLASRMDELGFSPYLIMGKGDKTNRINEEDSVKEDLFEAIIGAVVLDSGWEQKAIQSVVEAMLVPEDYLIDDADTNYVRTIQEWEMQENGCIPWYKYKEASYTSTWYIKEENTIYQNFPLDYNYSKLKYHCYLKLLDSLPVFCGFGISIREARMSACKLAYDYLEKNDMLRSIRDEIEDPNKEDAINQLEILARRGYFSIPTYEFEQTYDKDGNPIWKSTCHIVEKRKSFFAKSSSKKGAKKSAAYKMLQHVLND